MASPTSPIFQGVLEPFEEIQGPGVFDRPQAHAARHELDQMDKPQRKLSRNSSKSLWHRKSAKKSATPSATPPPNHRDLHFHLNSSQSLVATMDSKANDTSDEEQDHAPPMSRSIIPDPLNELPTWYRSDSELAAANVSTFRIKYPLHNPVGPKSYRNHHLIPPAFLNPNNRPPSVFSSSFPPMAPSLADHSQDSSRLPLPSRTPSATTLQTPSSSQVRIPDLPGKPRSRKTSQDNADLLDASDPWGTHWHHQSPYDTGSNISPVSIDSPDRSRSRLSSMNTVPTRHKTVIPSPLSQSTSALHTHPPEPNVTRKLSKQRKPVLANFFGGHDKGVDSTTSNSAAPQRASTIAESSLQVPNSSARRNSTSVPPSASTAALSTHSSTKKERRTSVLGRLVRKFSILKKSTQDPGPTISEQIDNELQEGASSSEARRSFVSQRQPSPEKPSLEKKHSDPSRRVPPPRIDSDLMTRMTNGRAPESEHEIPDHRSSISYEVPFSPGKLTITNPDTPSSGATSPIRISIALPSEDSAIPQPESKPHTVDTPQLRPMQPRQEHSANRESMSPGSPQPNGKTSPVKRVSPVPASSSSPSVVRSPAPQPIPQSPPLHPYHPFSPVSITTPASLTSEPATTEIRIYSIATSAIASTSDDSPLSKASLLVNPPTPYDYDINELHPDFPTDVPKVVQIEKVPGKAPSKETPSVKKGDGEVVRVAKSNSTTSRKTETFRLMRNPSDKVSSSGETITVEGEHWTVVNSSDAPRRRRTKDKVERNEKVEKVEKPSSSTRDRESRREQRRVDKAAQEAAENHQRVTSQSRTKQTTLDAGGPASERTPRSRSFDTSPRTSVVQPMTVFTIHGEPSRHRKSDDRPRDSQYQQSYSRPTRPSPASGVAHVERLPSTTTRPTSEMTSAADINALRAREAWEMDRLWKGRSMYHGHPEVNVIASPSTTRDSRHVGGEYIVDVPGHGSSHTSYLVQPLQAHPMPASVFYANMPSAPPPIIYTTASPYGQVLQQGGNQPSNRSLANSFAFPSTENPLVDRPNPLPRPPRQSNYQPVHLPVLSDRGSAAVSDYWTNNKYPPVPSH